MRVKRELIELTIIEASQIMEQIIEGRDIEYSNVTIKGNMDFSKRSLSHQKRFKDFEGINGAIYGSELAPKIKIKNSILEGDIDFSNAVFSMEIDFGGTTFKGTVDFNKAEFREKTWFGNSTFLNKADFCEAKFLQRAYFRGSKFLDIADFSFTRFYEDVHFSEAEFSNLIFLKSLFYERALFIGSSFNGKVLFANSIFDKFLSFEDAYFHAETNFEGAVFGNNSNSYLPGIRFGLSRSASLIEENNYCTSFSRSRFNDICNYSKVKFFYPAFFKNVIIYGTINFNNAIFFKNINFEGASFICQATNFESAKFMKSVSFKDVNFSRITDFNNVEFFQYTDFTGSKIDGTIKANNSYFGGSIIFADADIEILSMMETRIAEKAEVVLRGSRINRIYMKWELLKKHIKLNYPDFVDWQAFNSLIKNYKELSWDDDYDNCLYDYKSKKENGILADMISLIFIGYGVKLWIPAMWVCLTILSLFYEITLNSPSEVNAKGLEYLLLGIFLPLFIVVLSNKLSR